MRFFVWKSFIHLWSFGGYCTVITFNQTSGLLPLGRVWEQDIELTKLDANMYRGLWTVSARGRDWYLVLCHSFTSRPFCLLDTKFNWILVLSLAITYKWCTYRFIGSYICEDVFWKQFLMAGWFGPHVKVDHNIYEEFGLDWPRCCYKFLKRYWRDMPYGLVPSSNLSRICVKCCPACSWSSYWNRIRTMWCW